MISVVICSVNPQFLEQVKKNISDTIGLEYELLVWDNRELKLGLCEVYNRMADLAKCEVLCFVHEDIYFERTGWGKDIISLFNSRNELGVIGVAGSKYKSAAYSGWYTGIKGFDCADLVHIERGKVRHIYLKPDNGYNKEFEDVVCVDGVFICCRKEIWQKIRFNDDDLKGFHYYDLDFSLRASEVCSVSVLYNLKLVHVTHGGDFGDNWVITTFQFHKYFKERLPVVLPGIEVPETAEFKIKKIWLDVLKSQNVSFRNKLKWIYNENLYSGFKLGYSIFKFLFYKPLGLRYIHKRRT